MELWEGWQGSKTREGERENEIVSLSDREVCV